MIETENLVMIDSSAWIDAFQGRDPQITEKIRDLLDDDRAATCGPILFEIKRGLKAHERKKILPLFAALHRLDFDESIWEAAGDLDGALRARGRTLPAMDVLIASVCLTYDIPILTLDKHFSEIGGLKRLGSFL